MTKKRTPQEEMQEILEAVAASEAYGEFPDFEELVDSFKDSEASTQKTLRPNQLPPLIDISSQGLGVSNVTLASLAKESAAKNGYFAGQFPAVRIRFSDTSQTMLCIPVQKYDPDQKNLAPVTWTGDIQGCGPDGEQA